MNDDIVNLFTRVKKKDQKGRTNSGVYGCTQILIFSVFLRHDQIRIYKLQSSTHPVW